MAFNLLDTVKGLFTNDLISTTASSLGESEGGIQKALSGAIPSILAGMVSNAGNNTSGLLQMAKQAAGSGIFNNLGGFLGNDNNSLLSQGAEMLKGIFGDRAGSMASVISNFAGIKHSSASSILSMAAPVSLGALGQHAIDNNLDSGGLMSFLASQRNSIMSALPAGLAASAGVVTDSSVGHATTADTVHAAAYSSAHEEDTSGGGLKFLLPLLLGVLTVALCIYIFKGCSGQPKNDINATDSSVAAMAHPTDTVMSTVATNSRELFKVKLPNDTILDAYKGGIEDKLVSFLKTDYKKLGADSLKNVWFDFDNLNFKTASADITAESQRQVNNLAAILKAFPAVKLKVGGYTDKVGDETANKKLSGARAKSVQAALDKAGVGKQITGAEGYGSSFAIYPATALESDRVKDRHVSVSVRL